MFNKLISTLFPSPCICCGYLGEILCSRCFYKLQFEPHVREIDGMKICSAMYFEENSILEKLIYSFKYEHYAEIYKIFVPYMKKSLELLTDLNDLVFVPVPLHKKRELDRGYNQSYLIAKAVSKALGFEILNLLERVKNTESQAQTKSMEDRRNNIKDAFSVNGIIPENRQIVLVDDIVTTASTIIECKNVLNRSGATNIIALTLASREKNNSGNRCFEKRR